MQIADDNIYDRYVTFADDGGEEEGSDAIVAAATHPLTAALLPRDPDDVGASTSGQGNQAVAAYTAGAKHGPASVLTATAGAAEPVAARRVPAKASASAAKRTDGSTDQSRSPVDGNANSEAADPCHAAAIGPDSHMSSLADAAAEAAPGDQGDAGDVRESDYTELPIVEDDVHSTQDPHVDDALQLQPGAAKPFSALPRAFGSPKRGALSSARPRASGAKRVRFHEEAVVVQYDAGPSSDEEDFELSTPSVFRKVVPDDAEVAQDLQDLQDLESDTDDEDVAGSSGQGAAAVHSADGVSGEEANGADVSGRKVLVADTRACLQPMLLCKQLCPCT